MALNIKILMPLEHPPVTFPEKIFVSNLTAGQDDLQKQNREKHGLEDAEKKILLDATKKRLNIIK